MLFIMMLDNITFFVQNSACNEPLRLKTVELAADLIVTPF